MQRVPSSVLIRATKQYMIASLEPAPAWTVVGARDVELRAIRSAREMVGQEARRARRVVVRHAGVAQQPCRVSSGPVERGIIGHPEVPATVSSVVRIERDTIPLRFHASPDTGQGHGIGHEVWLDAIQCSLREFINKLVGLNVLVSRDPQQKHPAARIPRQESAQRRASRDRGQLGWANLRANQLTQGGSRSSCIASFKHQGKQQPPLPDF